MPKGRGIPRRFDDRLRELLLRQGQDIGLPYLAIFREVILVEVAKGISIHRVTTSSLCDEKEHLSDFNAWSLTKQI